jgi:hypothetical protein
MVWGRKRKGHYRKGHYFSRPLSQQRGKAVTKGLCVLLRHWTFFSGNIQNPQMNPEKTFGNLFH